MQSIWGESTSQVVFQNQMCDYLFWLHWILVIGIQARSCGMWGVAAKTGMEHSPLCVGVLATRPPGKSRQSHSCSADLTSL